MTQFEQDFKGIEYDSKNVKCENCGLIIVKGKYMGGARPHYMSKSCRNFRAMMEAERASKA